MPSQTLEVVLWAGQDMGTMFSMLLTASARRGPTPVAVSCVRPPSPVDWVCRRYFGEGQPVLI